MIQLEAMNELREPLADLGERWAASRHRPRPQPDILVAWDKLLSDWVQSDLPLVLRDQARRGETLAHISGRLLIFGDNSPANWSFGLALRGIVPSIEDIVAVGVAEIVPLSFLAKGEAAKRNLNRAGWKVCHINPVSDRKRTKPENSELDRLAAGFVRFLSPRNIFLIPKQISGAGELPEVIEAVAAYERVGDTEGQLVSMEVARLEQNSIGDAGGS